MTHIVLYTHPFCSFCLAAKSLLTRKGLAFEEIDVEFDAERRAEMMARAGGARRVPQIFVQGHHLGGYDELLAVERNGDLETWLSREPPIAEASGL